MLVVSHIHCVKFARTNLKSLPRTLSHLRNMSSDTSGAISPSGTTVRLEDVQFFVHDEVTSTQDVCKDMIRNTSFSELEDIFCVLAKAQNTGRGSRGRTWTGLEGNMFLTIAIKQSCIPCPLTLIPLRVGTLISPHVRSRVTSSKNTYLKWPNDILIGTEKVCGTIVEIENGRVVIGIGCNVAKAPSVPLTGADAGRVATCIASHSEAIASDSKAAIGLAADIAKDFKLWISTGSKADPAENIVAEFTSQMDKINTQKLRSGTDSGKDVLPLHLNIDGTLQVNMVDTGEERTLMAEYLF
jgi:biotin-(acetyl-CoA carboxylase) ligase